jgi:hypothetical protein
VDTLQQCGPALCDSPANIYIYNAANMAGNKQNTKIMAMVKNIKVKLLIKNYLEPI